MKLTAFFAPSQELCALPGWKHPRIIFPNEGFAARWEYSSFYPAFRLRSRLYRFGLRTASTLLPRVKDSGSTGSRWPLGELLSDVLPDAKQAVVRVGTPGPAQKVTFQLRDANLKIVGYLKFGEQRQARHRLASEFKILNELPAGLGPRPLKHCAWMGGEAMVVSAVPGKPIPATLPPPESVVSFSDNLTSATLKDIYDFTWSKNIVNRFPKAESCLAILAHRTWPQTIQHGDFVAWNLCSAEGQVRAFDWEYGEQEALPYLDLCYFVLQTGALIYKWAPEKAWSFALDFLSKHPAIKLTAKEADAFIRLTAYDAYLKSEEDGHPSSFPIQKWRMDLVNLAV